MFNAQEEGSQPFSMDSPRITALLNAHSSGDKKALDRLMPLVYDELHHIARNRLHGEGPDCPVSTNELVHETYLKLLEFNRIKWQDQSHFFAIVSQIMRNILVDFAVKQQAYKRGGKRQRVKLHDSYTITETNVHDALSLRFALTRLKKVNKRVLRVVECRFYHGLNVDETAETLGISTPTVYRDWKMARAWLNRELNGMQKPP